MADFYGLLCSLIVLGGGLLLALTVGGVITRNHRQDLSRRRAVLRHVLVTDVKTFPMLGYVDPMAPPAMLVAEVVLSGNRLQSFIANFKKIFGGELRSYHDLMLRAREEATLRLLEQASAFGYDAVCNLRIESADIRGNATSNKPQAPTVAVVASGTGYRLGASPAGSNAPAASGV